ncbi:MAG: Kelch repeat-containing protein [Promethearchaeota archaeon]|jgi:N-acetylneuraminic acid mutarotase
MKKIISFLIILTLILWGVNTVALPSIENNKKTKIEKICGTVLEKNELYGGGTWAYKTPLLTNRLDAVSAVVNGKISNKVEVYDPYTDQWEEKASLPIKSVHTTCVSFNNKIYVFGGQGPRGNEYHNEVFEYDVKEDVWNRKKPMPEYRFAPYAVIVENKIYVIGGAGNQENNYVYDPINDMWDTRARMPTDRDHLGVAVVDNTIYCIGGRTHYEAAPFDIVEVYDPVLDKWVNRSPIPTPRAGFYEIGVVDGKIYLIGGEQGDPQKKTFN